MEKFIQNLLVDFRLLSRALKEILEMQSHMFIKTEKSSLIELFKSTKRQA